MSFTYSEDLKPHPTATATEHAPFTPVYARKSVSRNKPVKTWMILAPIGVLVLGGATAAMLMSGGDETAPLAEPVAAAPAILPAAPITPVETAPAPVETTAATTTETTAQPAARAPVRPRIATPAERRAAPVQSTTPRVETLTPPAGPQPYTAPTVSTPPAARVSPTVTPTTAPVTTTSPPVVVIQPQG